MNITILVILILYGGMLMGTGLFWYRRKQKTADLLLANRSLNYWVTAIAAHASDMSAWLFMGFPAAIYTYGMPSAWIAIGLVLGMFLTWQFVAAKLRIATEHYGSLTIPSFLEHRYNDTSHLLKIISGTIIIFFIPYIAAGLTGMGRVFESVFSLNYHLGIFIGLGAAIFYLLIGGFAARAWNDFFQGIFLLCMIVIVPCVAFFSIGGLHSIIQAAALKQIPLSLFPPLSVHAITEILNGIMWGAGYFGIPHIIVNFMAIDNVAAIKKAQYLGMTWQIITLLSATAVGLIGIAYFMVPLPNPELIFIILVQKLFNPLMAGFILCAILAATITTIDTQILVVASTITHDFGQLFFVHYANKSWLFRISVVLVSLCAYSIAAQNSSTVMGLVTYAWSGLGSAFSPLIIASLYDTRITKQAALASLLSGACVAGLWPLYNATLLPLIPGFFVSACVLYCTSRLQPYA